jgi:hypothetical protein
MGITNTETMEITGIIMNKMEAYHMSMSTVVMIPLNMNMKAIHNTKMSLTLVTSLMMMGKMNMAMMSTANRIKLVITMEMVFKIMIKI